MENFLRRAGIFICTVLVGVCLFALCYMAYIHLGPYVYPQKEFEHGQLAGVTSGVFINGRPVLIYYGIDSDGMEKIIFPRYGGEWTTLKIEPTERAPFVFTSVSYSSDNEFRVQWPTPGKKLELDPGLLQKATKIFELGRKQFRRVGGKAPSLASPEK